MIHFSNDRWSTATNRTIFNRRAVIEDGGACWYNMYGILKIIDTYCKIYGTKKSNIIKKVLEDAKNDPTEWHPQAIKELKRYYLLNEEA